MKQEVDRSSTVIIGMFAVLAAGITLYQLFRPGFLFGLTPDIASWLGASIRLVHGAIPYRDFDMLQPPGFTLLASPFAFLSEWIGTRDALAVLRLCTPLLAAASVLLIGKVVRHRGPPAVIVACGVMALYPAELYALRSGLLESVVDFFCVAAAALMFEGDSLSPSRRRILLGGIAFGIAGGGQGAGHRSGARGVGALSFRPPSPIASLPHRCGRGIRRSHASVPPPRARVLHARCPDRCVGQRPRRTSSLHPRPAWGYHRYIRV